MFLLPWYCLSSHYEYQRITGSKTTKVGIVDLSPALTLAIGSHK
jgi:hypothetical protein